MKYVLLILSLVLVLGVGYIWLSNFPQINAFHNLIFAQENMLDQLKSALNQCVKDSRIYFVVEGLPQTPTIRRLIPEIKEPFWEKLTPEQNFFALEIVPEIRSQVPALTVAEAYCAAVAKLPGDWWGLPGGEFTETANTLLTQPLTRNCLVKLLDNTTPLSYLDGEANTFTKLYQWQVSDLAAGFILALLDQEYDAYASVDERNRVKAELKLLSQE